MLNNEALHLMNCILPRLSEAALCWIGGLVMEMHVKDAQGGLMRSAVSVPYHFAHHEWSEPILVRLVADAHFLKQAEALHSVCAPVDCQASGVAYALIFVRTK